MSDLLELATLLGLSLDEARALALPHGLYLEGARKGLGQTRGSYQHARLTVFLDDQGRIVEIGDRG